MDNNTNSNNNNITDNNNNNNLRGEEEEEEEEERIIITNMDLDLNQDPREGLGLLLDELETAHDQIEERIRRLESVTARSRQRHSWRLLHNHHHPPPSSSSSFFPPLPPSVPNETKSGKRDSSHLGSDQNSGVGGFFDCNICLDTAREPILTCCGHLFCWACFYSVSCVENEAKECPVCRGEVSDKGVTPIYGNGKDVEERESGSVVVPPRPKAHRVESFRQRRVARSATHIPVTEVLRRIRMGISGEDRARIRREIEGDSRGRWRIRTHQFSNVLPDSASSLYSISSALDNAERLVDDLESFVNGGFDGNSRVVDSSGSTSLVEREEVVEPSVVTPSSQMRAFSREIRRRRMG